MTELERQKPFWSWPIALVTIWIPAKRGLPPSLRGVRLGRVDRDAANYRRMQHAAGTGREITITGAEREVVHEGGQLPLRNRAIALDEVFSTFDSLPIWGRIVEEPGKGVKVEIRVGEPREGTTGVIPAQAIEAFIGEIRPRTVIVRAVWINPTEQGFRANLVVSTPEVERPNLVSEDEMFFFLRDGEARLGSRTLRPRKPNY